MTHTNIKLLPLTVIRTQVFHIDFGHFLNHRKKKFGINRLLTLIFFKDLFNFQK